MRPGISAILAQNSIGSTTILWLADISTSCASVAARSIEGRQRSLPVYSILRALGYEWLPVYSWARRILGRARMRRARRGANLAKFYVFYGFRRAENFLF
jgi:hypothetical protein